MFPNGFECAPDLPFPASLVEILSEFVDLRESLLSRDFLRELLDLFLFLLASSPELLRLPFESDLDLDRDFLPDLCVDFLFILVSLSLLFFLEFLESLDLDRVSFRVFFLETFLESFELDLSDFLELREPTL